MPAVLFSRKRRATAKGSALVIVLFFVILLTVVTIAFLSRSMTAARVSASSAGETKSRILANSASDIIIGDFKEEIIAGSAVNANTVNFPVYIPSSNQNAIPFQNGIPTTGTAIPNLISRSVNFANTGGTAPYVSYPSARYTAALAPPNRAANDPTNSKVNSTLPSLDGKFISLAQWNSHYLIPRNSPGTGLDSTPVSSFVAPDWVIVTRAGANSVTWSSGTGGLNDPTLTNTNYAVGRYAYAVYNEGGLLDMNVAGYPSGLTTAQLGRKGSLALADLTQLPLSTSNTTTMTQPQVDAFVGWRNYASSGVSGSFPSFIFNASSASNWLTNFVSYNSTNGFMQILPSGVTSTNTDQALLSRQQLISVINSIGISPDYLQYMGSFSRALEQPSVVPDSGRPRIINTGTAPPSNSNVASYAGNNDSVSKDDTYNPSFLSIRVPSTFTRLNGVAAVAGEPLVNRKWALSQLGLFNYASTTSSVQTAHATASDADPMLDRFGLTRTSATSPWTYYHGQNYIMTLAQVATAKREPDLAELLKAAMCVGSLAKGAPNMLSSYYNFSYLADVTTDYDVLQVMANLIDQYDTDSYPTGIQIALPGGSNTAGPYHVLHGVEDLPYIYRWHAMTVCDTLPTPASAVITQAQNGTVAAPSGFNGGDVKELYVVDLWNPHDASTLASSATLRPTKFRIYATWQDPDAQVTSWTAGPYLRVSYPGGYPSTAQYSPNYLSLTQANTAMVISDSSGGLAFREPTMIWRQSYPSGVSISAPSGTVVDAATGVTYCGIVVGSMPAEVQDTSNNLWQALAAGIDENHGRTAGTYAQINFALQYEYPAGSGSYITYDNLYSDVHGLQNFPNIVVNTADAVTYPNQNYKNPLKSKQVTQWGGGTVMDPRTIRFGVATGAFLGQAGNSPSVTSPNNGDYLLEPTAYANFAYGFNNGGAPLTQQTQNSAIGNTFTMLETDRPRADAGDVVDYSNPCQSFNPPAAGPGPLPQMRFYSGQEYRSGSGTSNPSAEFNGVFEQNNPAIKGATLSQSGTYSNAQLYYEDADGMNRRAAGAYANTSTAFSGAVDNAAADELGIPSVTAGTYVDGGALNPGNILPQCQSRPYILNRAFTSVSDMSYTFRNSPWRNINFFTPESGDTALLDTFCVNEPPTNALVAGKVDLNTRQAAVLKAVISGGNRDDAYNYASTTATATTSTYALKPLTPTEAGNVASALVNITTATDAWRGPLPNIGALVGRYVANPGSGASSASDAYSFNDPSSGNTLVYSGLSAMLGGGSGGPGASIYSDTSVVPSGVQAATPYTIQRFSEAGLRPLVDAGQVRVWNLLIDVAAQTGHYPKTATGFDQFVVEGQTRLWLHVAIDRYTGQVLDKQVEYVTP